MTSAESPGESLEKVLLKTFSHISFDKETRMIAENLRAQAIAEIEGGGEMCKEKQDLIDLIHVERGARKDEYLVVVQGDYGKDLEYGTRNSLESPWFIPAFVTVAGSIGNCLHGALKRALLKARRHHTGR